MNNSYSGTQPLIAPVEPHLISSELCAKRRLRHTNRGGNEIYVFRAHEAPNTMKELGRLREEAFRHHGGGTGKASDIDEYDLDPNGYQQLIVWDPTDKSIIGGYRFILGNQVEISPSGVPRLATAELFDFSSRFIRDYLPYTVELGRSFVAKGYQSTEKGSKAIFALDNLWDGIGALTIENPQIKYFYGKVTMYKQYNREARNLLLYFLQKHFADRDGLIKPQKPLDIDIDEAHASRIFPSDDFRENYKVLNRMIRALNISIPPLINSYMSLSPEMKVFGTVLNDHFGHVEETGIFIAIDRILEDKKKRHIDSYCRDKENGRA
ncbi:MAG: GNAT family N-acyltransferase [Porphyromonas sp.]|nr:GNAT family N-acyltransferase [Porphyromonas sp.]